MAVLAQKERKIPATCYVMNDDYSLKSSVQSKASIQNIIDELGRVLVEELYIIRKINEDEEMVIDDSESCMKDLMRLVKEHLISYKSERYPNGKTVLLLEYQFEIGKVKYSITEQEKPVNLRVV